MPMFSGCCRQGKDCEMPVDMFCCQVCGQSRCSGCQYGDRIELTNVTGFKGKGNVCKVCLEKVPTAQVVEDGITRNADVIGRVARHKPYCQDQMGCVEHGFSCERELQTELRNQGLMNDPEPVCCPTCQGDLYKSQGMVGERVMVCALHGMVWEDHEDAIRRVI